MLAVIIGVAALAGFFYYKHQIANGGNEGKTPEDVPQKKPKASPIEESLAILPPSATASPILDVIVSLKSSPCIQAKDSSKSVKKPISTTPATAVATTPIEVTDKPSIAFAMTKSSTPVTVPPSAQIEILPLASTKAQVATSSSKLQEESTVSKGQPNEEKKEGPSTDVSTSKSPENSSMEKASTDVITARSPSKEEIEEASRPAERTGATQLITPAEDTEDDAKPSSDVATARIPITEEVERVSKSSSDVTTAKLPSSESDSDALAVKSDFLPLFGPIMPDPATAIAQEKEKKTKRRKEKGKGKSKSKKKKSKKNGH